MPRSKPTTRRRFLTQTLSASAGSIALPYFIPASALGLGESVAPSNRITIGMIGVGRQVLAYNLPFFMSQPDCEVVALCDVDRWRLEVTEERTASYYGEQKNRCPKIPGLSAACRFPRSARPQGHRRGHDLHAGPLARAHVGAGR